MVHEVDIAIRSVSKTFGDVAAVSDVDLEIKRGEFFALLGPSGCGKTTLMRMLAGFEHPTRGEIALRGVSANGVPPERRPTNLVFQNLALFPHLDVSENVEFGLRMAGGPNRAARVAEALRLVRLEGFEKRAISQISGGQKQRVAIARALVNDPLVLLLDEPLSSLDLKLRQEMQLELKTLQTRLGTTFVYVTHDQSEAMTMADRIAVMNGGRIEQVGTPQEIYLRPRSHFVAAFIGESNLFPIHPAVRTPGLVTVSAEGLGVCTVNDARAGDFLLVRPEFVQVGPRAAALANRYEARVVQRIFQGASTRVEFRLPSARPLVAEVRAAEGEGLEPGATAIIGWGIEDCSLVESSRRGERAPA